MDSIIEVARAALRGDAVERLSRWAGESPLAVQKCVDAAVPLAVVGIARHASTEGRAQGLLDGIEDKTYPHVEPSELEVILDNRAATDRVGSAGEGALQRTFGNKREAIIDALASYAGVSRASASKLLGLATSLVVGVVHHQVRTHSLDARGLSRYLGDQERSAAHLIPTSLAGALGTVPTVVSDVSSRVTDRSSGATRAPESTPTHQASTWKWLPWLVAGAAVIALLSFAFNRKPQRFNTMNRPVTNEAARSAQPPAPAAPPADTLSPATGADALARYLAGGDQTPRRFLVEGVEFESGSANVPSTRTLDAVAAVLIAQPRARIRVEAHPDAGGSPSANEALAQDRAESVKSYLTQRGVPADHIDTAGVGAGQPHAASDTPEGRDRNRRVEIVVIEH